MKPPRRKLATSLAEILAEFAASGRPTEAVACRALEAIADDEPATPIIGIDEAGRGPLAGPVVAAAVHLGATADCTGIDDSKRLSAAARERLALAIRAHSSIGLAIVEAETIDRMNILEASMLAMERALGELESRLGAPSTAPRADVTRPAQSLPTRTAPAIVLVDGNRLPRGFARHGARAQPVVGGDARIAAIAAASIIAKTVRDALMTDLAQRHPGYGWESNMGYGTAVHIAAIARLGPTPQHRQSFAPVRQHASDGAVSPGPPAGDG